jgi:hypothetical protein
MHQIVQHWKKILQSVLVALFLILPAERLHKYEFPLYRFVLDPGHGGVSRHPSSKYGDKYDLLSGKFLSEYREGATFRGIRERDVVYNIAEKAYQLLLHCAPGGDFQRFRNVLKKYTQSEPKRIFILSKKSRGRSLGKKEELELDDPNEKYRYFDFPGKDGSTQPGRISRINSFKPHLVLSLHHAVNPPREKMGLNPVIVPSYDFLHKGLQYLKGDKSIKKKLNRKLIYNWFTQDTKRSSFKWFLSDVSYYFTGYPLDRKNRTNFKDFTGYRYNMVSWAYRDSKGWEKDAINHEPGTPYSKDYGNIAPEGKFWERERSIYEKYRREGGMEGFGGDNNYASYEIIRYILYALKMNGLEERSYFPGSPYIGVWILPLHMNAVSPFIELGYLRKRFDRFVLTKKQDIIAEGIAVAVYSLFAGLELKDKGSRHTPRGKRIDLGKYKITTDTDYFEAVSE